MIFISYSRKDSKYVTLLVNICKAQKIKIFIDIQSINFGEKWLPALEKAIRDSEKFYLFWSKNANQSDYVRKEIDLVKKKENPVIIPIIMDNTPLPDKISEYNGFEYVKNEYDELRRLEKSKNSFKISTYILTVLIILISLSSVFNFSTNEYIESSDFKNYSPSLVEDHPEILKDDERQSEVDSTKIPKTFDEETIAQSENNNIFLSPEYFNLILLAVLIYFIGNYIMKKRLLKVKVKEFVEHF